jgi:CheY-like chemotaxis protein
MHSHRLSLVVDDQATSRMTLASLIEPAGYALLDPAHSS